MYHNNISFIIRAFNEDKYISNLMQTLLLQAEKSQSKYEFIVIDSGSTDNTTNIVKLFPVKLISIPKNEFNYSKALNLGIENSSGDLLIIISAHILPCQNFWLKRLISHFEDEKIAGVFCRQVPWPDAPWYEVNRIEKQFQNISKCYSLDIDNLDIPFSNVGSCVRRDLWERHPFQILPAREDREWAKWAILNGYRIIYDAEISVYHSHNESPRKVAQRIIALEKAADILNKRKRTFPLTLKQGIGWSLREIRNITSTKSLNWKKIFYCSDAIRSAFWFVADF
ncbi:MAG: glycosyltransferase [Phycisphaerae bacterium]